MADEKSVTIYGLADPRIMIDGYEEVRYVGLSSKVEARFEQHLSEALGSPQLDKSVWVKEIMAMGKYPTLLILETVLFADKGVAESRWIKYYANLGHRLFNVLHVPIMFRETVSERVARRKARLYNQLVSLPTRS